MRSLRVCVECVRACVRTLPSGEGWGAVGGGAQNGVARVSQDANQMRPYTRLKAAENPPGPFQLANRRAARVATGWAARPTDKKNSATASP